MEYLQVVAGLAALMLAGDSLVRGAVFLSHRHGLSPLFVGTTVVAFGTSAPELFVGIDGVLAGVPTLTLGNIVGSNIANILLVLGLPALITPLCCNTPGLTHNVVAMILASCFFTLLCLMGVIGFWQGLILLALLFAYLGGGLYRAKKNPEEAAVILENASVDVPPTSRRLIWGLIIAGLLGLVFGAHLLILGSVTMARNFGVSEAIIGLTLVALGTSLPELATCLASAFRNQCDVAVGNIVGSNIFNILGIAGVSSLFGAIPVPYSFIDFDLWVMLGSSLILLPYALRRATIGRAMGLFLILAYAAYITLLALGVGGPHNGLSHA